MLPKKYKEETKGEKIFYSIVIVILYIIIAAAFGLAIFLFLKDLFEGPINYIGAAITFFAIMAIIGEDSGKK